MDFLSTDYLRKYFDVSKSKLQWPMVNSEFWLDNVRSSWDHVIAPPMLGIKPHAFTYPSIHLVTNPIRVPGPVTPSTWVSEDTIILKVILHLPPTGGLDAFFLQVLQAQAPWLLLPMSLPRLLSLASFLGASLELMCSSSGSAWGPQGPAR